MSTLSRFESAHAWYRTLVERGHSSQYSSECQTVLAKAVADMKAGRKPSPKACIIISEFYKD